ncbi:hypothetical protein [Methylocystis echinoides]|uniref:Uncharacterized protein n=1 Tax=Methylocystis echinoides TaxID=29468 RepID=A0A9W6LU04_9HYPH|nr:hypothetical protein [Methylocystis echinoides]GLI95032.1 hypothetical protein LMG27198_40240 [Methylocystis echinoides]
MPNPEKCPPTRRLFLAAGPASVVFVALSAAAMGERAGNMFAAAILRHRAASATIDAYSGPGDLPEALVDAETAALIAVSRVPCADDGQFFQKLSYLLEIQKRAYGRGWADSYAEEILVAIDLHLNAGGSNG